MSQLVPVLFRSPEGELRWGTTEDVNDECFLVKAMGDGDATFTIDEPEVIYPKGEFMVRQRSRAVVAQEFTGILADRPGVALLKVGDLVEVIELEVADEGDGWCRVKCQDGRTGIFPLILLDFMENF